MATFEQEKERQSKKQYAYQYYINKGYRPIEAAAIVGNLDIESGGFSPDVIAGTNKNKDNGSEGVAQWRLDRLDRLKGRYKNPKDFDSQLDFVDWELNNTHKEALVKMRQSSNIEEATSAFTWEYEKPSKNLAHFDKRLTSAASVLGSDAPENSSFVVDRSTYVDPTPLKTETSTTEYKEPQETKEVEEAKQDIAEKSFAEDFKSIIESQQEQINNLQASVQQAPEQSQQQEQFASEDMLDAYNYIGLDPGYDFSEEQFQKGGIIEDDRGQWNHPGQQVVVPTDGNITMRPDPRTGRPIQDVLIGISLDTGEQKIMYPGEDYYFKNTKKVKEIPVNKNRFK